jgi:hypothetical protein
MEVLKKIFGYVNVFKKPDPNAPSSFNLKVMHGINRISILMFLVCVIILIVRAFR